MNRTRIILAAAGTAFGIAFVAACGSGSYGAASNSGSYSSSTQSTQSAAPSTSQAAQGVSLNVATIGNLGQVVTDGNGMTLYRFDKDTAKPPVSNCNGACATLWPPVLAGDGQLSLNGIDKGVIGTVARQDGSKQVTINGWPIYRYAKDTKPGDAQGQGVGGTWFAVTAQGKQASGSPVTAPAATSSQSSSGYGSSGYSYSSVY